MRYNIILLPVLLIILITGCDETRPGLINDLIFNDDTDWVDRNSNADPAELVDGECCNDFIPFPLGEDSSLTARIDPLDDLDWFELQTGDSLAGALFFSTLVPSINFRVFDGQQQEYELLVDSLQSYARYDIYYPVTWVVFSGRNSTYNVLVQSQGELEAGDYRLIWAQEPLVSPLALSYPKAGAVLIRGLPYKVKWTDALEGPVSLALLKDGLMVAVIVNQITSFTHELQYHFDTGLDPGTAYQIMVYRTNDPHIMDVSDEFEIR